MAGGRREPPSYYSGAPQRAPIVAPVAHGTQHDSRYAGRGGTCAGRPSAPQRAQPPDRDASSGRRAWPHARRIATWSRGTVLTAVARVAQRRAVPSVRASARDRNPRSPRSPRSLARARARRRILCARQPAPDAPAGAYVEGALPCGAIPLIAGRTERRRARRRKAPPAP